MKRIPLRSVAAAGLLGALSMLARAQTAPTITIVDVPQSQYIQSVGFKKCVHAVLDGSEGSEPPGRLATCAQLNEQRWRLSGNPDSGYLIKPQSNSNLCLDIVGSTIDSERTKVVLYTCQSNNRYQRWSVAAVKTPGKPQANEYLIFNVGLLRHGGAGTYVPKVLSIWNTSEGSQLQVINFKSGDHQLPKPHQLWTSSEIYCYHSLRKHAQGLQRLSFSVGGNPITDYTPNCK
jgi:hypothetical protein